MKVSELSGALLDYWVAKCESREARIAEYTDGNRYCVVPAGVCSDQGWTSQSIYFPSSAWSVAGPLIERERIALFPAAGDAGAWMAQLQTDGRSSQFGPTALVAAMRCFIWSKYGDEVPA